MSRKASSLEQFIRNFREEATERAKNEGTFQIDAFTSLFIEYLTDEGELNDGEVCFFKERNLSEVSGYSWDEEFETLDLFITIDADDELKVPLHKTVVEPALERLKRFFSDARDKKMRGMEESSPAYELAQRIEERKGEFKRLRLFLFTDGLLRDPSESKIKIGNVPASIHFWDMKRMWDIFGKGTAREPIVIDFKRDFDLPPVSCITTPVKGSEYDAFLAIMPGELLFRIYEKYGDRLLEKNVRSFLQVSGRVNKGIQETIREQPERFLAYNNGISATAASVKLIKLPDGGVAIESLTDFQVVNGGQTTASIYHAHHSQERNISKVFVQAKITVVREPGKVEELVPWISRYANSQNKVNDADFYATDPLHVKLEELSRSIKTPPHPESGRETYWFFERARGQYLDCKNSETDAARRKSFVESNPTRQKFSKTDMAKFINSWERLPFIVSLGAEKNFKKFSLEAGEAGMKDPSPDWYKELIAKAILFKTTEKIVQSQQFGGYRANTVTYTIAWISQSTPGRVNFQKIWDEQKIDSSLEEVILRVCKAIRPAITDSPNGANVTEWCKKEECWEAVREVELDLPDAPKGVRERPIERDIQSVSVSELADSLKLLLTAEGPATGRLLFRVFAEKNRIRRLTKGVNDKLLKALKRAVSEGLIEQENQLHTRGLESYVFRLPGQKDEIKPGNKRSLEEIAPSEVAMAMRVKNDSAKGEEVRPLLRAVLKDYGYERIRATHEQFVDAVERIYQGES